METMKEKKKAIYAEAYRNVPGALEQRAAYKAACERGDWDGQYPLYNLAEEEAYRAWDAEARRLAAAAAAATGLDEDILVCHIREKLEDVDTAIAAAKARAAEDAAQKAAAEEAAKKSAAAAAAWEKLLEAARNWMQRELPRSPAEIGDRPARWVKTSRPADDGMRGSGDDAYYAGISASQSMERAARLELRPDWAARWELAVASGPVAVAEFLEEFKMA